MNGAAKPPASASLELRSNIYQTTAKSSREVSASEAKALANGASQSANRGVSFSCDTCGVDCTAVRYHSLKQKNYELCPTCYLDGRFPSTMFSGDFVKLTAVQSNNTHGANGATSDDWSDQEVLLLLEGVEMYDDDWSAIEEHVGTRSAQQCVRKFLELPIEDPYLEAESEGVKGPLRYARLPFDQADNPVMSVVAFLAGVVSPGVAAEAAKTALHELTDGNTETTKEEGAEKTSADNAEKADENMASDDMPEHKAEGTEEDGMAVDGPTGDSTAVVKKSAPSIPHSKVQRAARLALQASTKSAQALADAESQTIRTTLAQLIKLTLERLELKMSQFEEMETVLEEERRALEAQRLALANERTNMRKTLENVRAELAKNSAAAAPPGTAGEALATALSQSAGAHAMQPKVTEVASGTVMEGDAGPVADGTFQQIG